MKKQENVMTTLKGSKTHENLKNASASEAQTNRRYAYFANQANVEGYPDIAGLFRDTAKGEASHGNGHLDYLTKLGDPMTDLPMGTTASNIEASIVRETYESTDLYPGMAKTAREEGFADIAEWFETLAKAEKNHASRFSRGRKSLA
jgi:rubrerythrin